MSARSSRMSLTNAARRSIVPCAGLSQRGRSESLHDMLFRLGSASLLEIQGEPCLGVLRQRREALFLRFADAGANAHTAGRQVDI
jgi:hypothetical protein